MRDWVMLTDHNIIVTIVHKELIQTDSHSDRP